MYLPFNSNSVILQLKTNWGETEKPYFVIFVVWSYLIVGGWVVVPWTRKCCLGPADIASFLFLLLFKDGERRVSPRFHPFVSDVNQGNPEACGFERATRGFELVKMN